VLGVELARLNEFSLYEWLDELDDILAALCAIFGETGETIDGL